MSNMSELPALIDQEILDMKVELDQLDAALRNTPFGSDDEDFDPERFMAAGDA